MNEMLDFWLCRHSQPFKGPNTTLCGLFRFLWWEFVQLPVLRRWHLFWRRHYQIERPDLIERDRLIQMHLDAKLSRRPLTDEQKKRLRDILKAEEMQEYPDTTMNGRPKGS